MSIVRDTEVIMPLKLLTIETNVKAALFTQRKNIELL